MIPVWWSVLLTAVGVLGIWLAGRKRAAGFAVGLAAQVLWLAYAVVTEQWGFIGSALAYGFVYAQAFRRWRREARTP